MQGGTSVWVSPSYQCVNFFFNSVHIKDFPNLSFFEAFEFKYFVRLMFCLFFCFLKAILHIFLLSYLASS